MGQRAKGTVTIAVVVVGIVFPGAIPRSGPTHGHRPAVEQRPQPAPLAPARSDVGRAQAARAGIDVGAVVDTVRHRVHLAPDRSEALEVTDAHYRARFDAAGFVVAPVRARASVAISLTGARRGGVGMALAPTPWHGVANVARRQVAPALTERVTAREGELEWDVILARPPPGRGDLLVEARLGGLNGAPTPLADGWRLPLADAASVRLGQLVVKDAGGTELARALPRLRGKHLQLLVPASVLDGAAYPITLDPTVSPEHPVSDPVYGGAAGDQSRPAVAFDGTNFLVVWDDRRSGPAADVFGARVSRAGTVLDPAGIPISTATGDQGSPAVAFDGTNFLAVWTDLRSGPYDVFGARVTPSGTVLDPAGIPISTAADDQFNSAVGFDGTNFLVVWTDLRSVTSADVFGTRVSRTGTVLDPAGIPISTAVNDQQAPALAFDGTNFLVVWTDRRADVTGDVFGTRVSRAGTVLDPAGIPVASGAGGQFADAVAFGGTNFLVVWYGPHSTNADVFGTRVSRTGTVLDPAGVPIATAANGQLDAAVAFDGNDFLVVWQDARSGSSDIYGARVSPAGTVLDPAGIPISTAANGQGSPAVGFDGTNFLVVWADRRSGGVGSSGVFGARMTRAGTVLDPAGINISIAANFQSDPAVAYDGTNFLVVWTDYRFGAGRVFGSRVTPSGTVLDAAGIPIATASGDQRNPVIAFDGTNFLVAWTGVRSGIAFDVFAARVSRAGVVLDPTDIPVSTGPGAQSSPAVAFDGANFLVVWQDFRSGVTFDVFGARVTRTGAVLDPAGIPITTAANGQFAPAVAFDGTNYLVVWTDSRFGAGDVFGARVTPSGTVLDPAGIPIATGPGPQQNPALAFDGTNFLVVWEGFQPGSALDIVGARVSRAGMVLDASGIPISAAARDESSPAVAFDGVNFLVVWADRRPRFGRRGADIVGARVRADGTVRDPSGLMIAGARTDEATPAIAAVPGQGWGVVYQRNAPEAPYAANRVFLRTVSRR